MTRPSHLPDYGNPPLHEVVLGVQFATPAGYSQIRAGEVWSLYREDYPEVEEHPMLPASFETFGPRNRGIQPQLEFIQGASHDRFWFLSPDRTELIQFQNNRLLHNWREIPGTDITYPRFDYMIGRFESEIRKFSSYAKELSGQDININQCEVTYINNINTSEDLPNFSDWLNMIDFKQDPEDLLVRSRRPIYNEEGAPIGRLSCEVGTAVTPTLDPIIAYHLTVRGAPSEPTIEGALHFLYEGRELIVTTFTETTTAAAHRQWERKR